MIVQIVIVGFLFAMIGVYQITYIVFKYFEKNMGSSYENVFANCKNKKVDKFYSKYWNPGATVVDDMIGLEKIVSTSRYYCM